MLEKFQELEQEFNRLEKELSRPEIISNNAKFSEYAKRYGELKIPVEKYREYNRICDQYQQASSLYEQEEGELRDLAGEDMALLSGRMEKLREELKVYLIPKDPDSAKDIIMELRAGTGGEEAALFCAELFRMYTRYAESRGWKMDIYSSNNTGLGGIKEVIASIEGKNVYDDLKWESGVHRVQRIPETETGGRIHTSACSVAVLPQADSVEVNISREDLRIDTYRASGAGGQHVNVTDSAVRITHLPTGLVVQCQDERSQMQNRRKAMNILRARLKDKIKMDQEHEKDERRRKQIGSGDRSEKIRTYNYPQNRVTDHRVNLTVYNLSDILNGNIGKFINEIKKLFLEKQMRQ
ncbi:MAG: peptide chain release factor 1 [Elusimicrobia bacterium]|nr:peptide chain release factor 1 [Elusimicrobiota bacterium]